MTTCDRCHQPVIVSALATLVLSVLLVALPTFVVATTHPPFTGKVVGVSDSDTLSVLRNGKAVKVRLYGIDGPEKAQAFGTQARQVAADLAFGKIVTVQVRTIDRYGRIVGHMLLPDGRSLTYELVRRGMAWWYRDYAKHDALLAQLEAEARQAKLGLWTDPNPVPPWQWRKDRTTATTAKERKPS